MTLSVKHSFQSAKGDGADPTIIQPSHWNDEHELTASANVLLGRGFSAGEVTEIACTQAARNLLDDQTPVNMRSTLGLVIGVNVQRHYDVLDNIGNIQAHADNFIVGMADEKWHGRTAAEAREHLGLGLGSDVQPYDAGLAAIAALPTTDSNIIVGNGATWVAESGSVARASLGLALGVNAQAWDVNLDQIAAIVPEDNKIIVGNISGVWVGELPPVARASLGLAIGTDVQAYSASLQALAGLTPAADKLPYYTGAATSALTGFTLAARNLLDDASVADMRTTLGINIGTNVQAYDIELNAIAGLVSANNTFPYFTGLGTAALAVLQPFARTLLDDPDQNAMQATLGVRVGIDVQAASARLTEISTPLPANGTFYVGNGASIVPETGAVARASLGIAGGGACQVAHSWGCVTIISGSPSLSDGSNVASVTDAGTGLISVTLTVAHGNSSYAILATCDQAAGAWAGVAYLSVTTNSFTISTAAVDANRVSFATFGDG